MVRRYFKILEFQFICAIFLNEVFQYLNCTIFKVVFDNEDIFINKEKTVIANLFIRCNNSLLQYSDLENSMDYTVAKLY